MTHLPDWEDQDELDDADDGWDGGCGIPGCDCMTYDDSYWDDGQDEDDSLYENLDQNN